MHKPIFPIVLPHGQGWGEVKGYGLTTRELFAAMAMQGFALRAMAPDITGPTIAHLSVLWADHLILELAKSPEAAP